MSSQLRRPLLALHQSTPVVEDEALEHAVRKGHLQIIGLLLAQQRDPVETRQLIPLDHLLFEDPSRLPVSRLLALPSAVGAWWVHGDRAHAFSAAATDATISVVPGK